MLKIIWPQKEKYLKKRYTCRACPFQFQETKVLGKHLELVQPCLGIKVIIFDPKRPWLVYQLRALQLVNWSVTKLRLVQRITFFKLNWSPSSNKHTNKQKSKETSHGWEKARNRPRALGTISKFKGYSCKLCALKIRDKHALAQHVEDHLTTKKKYLN